MKKNNTAEKAILDAEKITKALKEGTEKNLLNIMNEALSNIIKESDEEDVEDDSYEEEDVPTPDTPAVDDNEAEGEETETPEDGEEGADDTDDADDEWSDMEQYKVGDDDYDITGVNGDEVLKVFNKLGDDDQIFVKKEDDGTYSVKDDETGAEFVIELDPEVLGGEADDDFAEEDDDIEFDLGDEEEDDSFEDDSDEISFDFDDEGEEDFGDSDEVEIDINDDEENLNEDLGYTDSYQKDVFAKKFNMNEPADSKSTYSMDDGAPEGANKPWAGKGDSKPFDKKVNECGDGTVVNPDETANLEENGGTISSTDARHMKKGQIKQHRPNAPAYDVRKEDSYLSESIQKIIKAAKQIQAENKEYRNYIDKIKVSLYEAAVLNVNLGKLVDILVNETTTKDEKKKICERFNNVKTIAEGKTLYSTIKSELKENKKSSPIVEKQFVAESKNLNETKIYQNSNDPSIDLMNRMDNLFKK